MPYAGGPTDQRFFHMAEDGDTGNRVLLETRGRVLLLPVFAAACRESFTRYLAQATPKSSPALAPVARERSSPSYRSTSAPAAPPRRGCRHAMRSSACALSGAPFSSASPGGAEGDDAAGGGDANSPAGAGEVVAGRDGPDADADGALRAATDRAAGEWCAT